MSSSTGHRGPNSEGVKCTSRFHIRKTLAKANGLALLSVLWKQAPFSLFSLANNLGMHHSSEALSSNWGESEQSQGLSLSICTVTDSPCHQEAPSCLSLFLQRCSQRRGLDSRVIALEKGLVTKPRVRKLPKDFYSFIFSYFSSSFSKIVKTHATHVCKRIKRREKVAAERKSSLAF